MADIELEEIDRWLASFPTETSELAGRAYALARGAHRGGELPKFMRNQWHDLPKDYRAFLTFITQFALNAHASAAKDTP
jgi:hypothetical protein